MNQGAGRRARDLPGLCDEVSVAVEIASDGSVRDVQLSPAIADRRTKLHRQRASKRELQAFPRETYRVNYPYRVRAAN